MTLCRHYRMAAAGPRHLHQHRVNPLTAATPRSRCSAAARMAAQDEFTRLVCVQIQ